MREKERDPTFFSFDRGLDTIGPRGQDTRVIRGRGGKRERERGRENPSARGTACRLPLADFHPLTSKRAKFRYAQPRFSFSFFFLSFFFFFPSFVSRGGGDRGGNRRQSDADADHRMGTDDNCFS